MNQSELAAALGMESHSQVSRWEKGWRSPDPEVIARISEVTRRPVSWFYRGTSTPPITSDESAPAWIGLYGWATAYLEEVEGPQAATLRRVDEVAKSVFHFAVDRLRIDAEDQVRWEMDHASRNAERARHELERLKDTDDPDSCERRWRLEEKIRESEAVFNQKTEDLSRLPPVSRRRLVPRPEEIAAHLARAEGRALAGGAESPSSTNRPARGPSDTL